MNPADATNADSTEASADRSPGDAGVHHDSAAATWDPYDVWLTRIKQPRERATRVVARSTSSNAIGVREMSPAR